AVESSHITDGTITSADLGADSVTADKINADVVGAGLTQDTTTGALTVDTNFLTADLATGTISSDDITVTGGDNAAFKDVTLAIADGAVTYTKLGLSAVESSHILDGAITAVDLGTDSVTADKINADV